MQFTAGDGRPARPGPAIADDLIQPFKIEGQAVRGRLVRLGPLIDAVLERHRYPRIVAERLGELVALAAALAGALKYDGVFTLQTKGDGPIGLMVADVSSGGDVRGYAQFDAEKLAALAVGEGGPPSVPRLLGAGYLAFTVDQGAHTERYQGIVELIGATLADCVHHYFRQSEQLDAVVKVAAGRMPDGWRAGALMLQRLPPSAGAADAVEDEWRRTLAFMASSTPDELLDAGLTPNQLLYRLFHEDGVRVFATAGLRPGCRCSRARVERVLLSLPADELETFKIDGKIVVTCEFCSASYDFTDEQIAVLRDSGLT
ncbi:MAG: Hsp33 family molecular chaperone HslO [Dongiaceae bacterium]